MLTYLALKGITSKDILTSSWWKCGCQNYGGIIIHWKDGNIYQIFTTNVKYKTKKEAEQAMNIIIIKFKGTK